MGVEVKLSGLKAVLERNRLQQKQVAAAIGVSRNAVFSWVHGLASPRGNHLIVLLTYLRQFEPGLTAEEVLVSEPAAVTDGAA